MAHFYVDSSVLVKRHIAEHGSAWFRALADPAAGTTIITAQISIVEVVSASQIHGCSTRQPQQDWLSMLHLQPHDRRIDGRVMYTQRTSSADYSKIIFALPVLLLVAHRPA